MNERLKYLIELKEHCDKNEQRFTRKNLEELNTLLTAYHAKNLLENENNKPIH